MRSALLTWKAVAASAVFIFLTQQDAQARRVALVIGNSSYQNVPKLTNPANDSRAVADALKSIGFNDVWHRVDLNHGMLLRSLKEFGQFSTGSEISLIYFAGHGVEVAGRNYLVPVDATLSMASDVAYETITLEQVRGATSGANRLRLVILDACRNNPFKFAISGGTRSLSRGLAVVDEPTSNELIAFAARAGTVASDGAGHKNSPYATALVESLVQPELEIRQLFGRIRDQVISLTSRGQEPFIYGSLGGEGIFLNPKQVVATPSLPTPPISEAALAWSVTKDSPSVAVLEAFITSYPNTAFASMARARIEELKNQTSPRQGKPEAAEIAYADRARPVAPATSGSVSYWDHNGSRMKLLADGSARRFVYDNPRSGMISEGVSPGTLLFEGKRIGSVYSGTAYIFNKRCGSLSYSVEGAVSSDQRTVTMKGLAPSYDKVCRMVRSKTDTLVFSLIDD